MRITPRYFAPATALRISQTHPLARGLCFAAYTLNGGWYDAVSGTTALNTANLIFADSLNGNKKPWSNRGRDRTGSASGHFRWVNQTGLDKVQGAVFSVFIEGGLSTNGGTQTAFSSGEGTNGDLITLRWDDGAAVTNGFITTIANGTGPATNFDDLGANSETFIHRIALTCDGVNGKTYCNGLLGKTTAFTTAVGLGTTARVTRIGGRSNATPTADNAGEAVNSALILVWDRVALSADQINTLTVNPWQVFEPIRSYASLGVSAAAGSAGDLNAAGAATATFTSASRAGGDLSGAATSTGLFVGASRTGGDLNGAGVATAFFTASSTAAGVLNAAGTATVSFEGAGVAPGATAMSAAGTSSATFVGASKVASTLSASGSALAKFVGAGGSHGSTIISLGARPMARRKPLREENEEIMELVRAIAPDMIDRIRRMQ